MKTKVCSKCKKEKTVDEFHKDKTKKDGLQGYCKFCSNEQHRKYYLKNKERLDMHHKRWERNNPIKVWCNSTITKHKKRGYKVLFKAKNLYPIAKEIKYCPICKIKLSWDYGTKEKGGKFSCPSLDRTDNEKILELNNIQVICRKCNMTKLDRTMKEFIDYCGMVWNQFKKEK